MILTQLDKSWHTFFASEKFAQIDKSFNGLQVGDERQEISTISFALDACDDAIELAIANKSDLLFVHHGFYWGNVIPVTQIYYQRIKKLINHNLALYAMHLPLDAHPLVGNNITVAKRAQLTNITSFEGIGFGGTLEQPLPVVELAKKVYPTDGITLWPFAEKVDKIAVIVGGAARMIYKIYDLGYNCFITGEVSHEIYHFCQENQLSVIAAGHYQSEMYGLISFKDYISAQYPHLKTHLIELPTGC